MARARNAGARHAVGNVLVFIDADVIVPPQLLDSIHAAMNDPSCVGGAVDVDYWPQRRSMRLYLGAWRLFSRLTGMAQGTRSSVDSVSSNKQGATTRRRGTARM